MAGVDAPATPLTRCQHLIRSQICHKLKTKADALGIPITEAPQFYASSKTCSRCGHKKKDLTLSERTYHYRKTGNAMALTGWMTAILLFSLHGQACL